MTNRLLPTALTAIAMVLAACQPAAVEKPVDAAAPVAPADMEAIKAQAVALTVANPDCELQEGRERPVEAVDLGGGDVGVVVGCSAGMVEVWSYLYVSKDGAAPVRAPLIQYDVRGDGQWRDDDTTAELAWDAEDKVFAGATNSQATGCANGASWRWDGSRMVLVRQWIIDCDAKGADGELPDPKTLWPTTPPTPEPKADNTETE